MKCLKSASLEQNLQIINIESKFNRALPKIEIVGLASTTIKEAAIRVKSALLNFENFKMPPMEIVINLSPSDVKKDGSHFDLPIALLIMLQKIKFDNEIFVFGELGLDGKVKATAELFSILLFLSTKVKKASVLVPKEVALKAAMIPNLEVYWVENLQEAFKFFVDPEFKKQQFVSKIHPLFEKTLKINNKEFIVNHDFELDFGDIKGQTRAKRACVISATGFHNILFEGSPGCGKSMSAKRLRYILPPQSKDEILLALAYESLNSNSSDFSALRPFRSPHHTSTRSSIFGGGSKNARIGELALANGGILFFDELPHFGKQILESLREPLEDNKINISRVHSKVSYETKFLFVGAMNPCPCGNLFNKNSSCTCSTSQIERYKNSISQAIIDRIDLYVAMSEINPNDKADMTSLQMQDMVLKGFEAQVLRGQSEFNAKLNENEVGKYCELSLDAQNTLDKAIFSYNLSQRGISKVSKVARTIADLENSKIIEKKHIIESLSFRMKS